MAELSRHGSPVTSVFGLLGADENDLTSALGFVLARSPALLTAVLQRVWPAAANTATAGLDLDLEVRGEGGRTDLEITVPGGVVIVEAKRDWILPSLQQLAGYAPRVQARGDGVLVTLSQASAALAAARLPRHVDGIPVVHLSWRDILADLRRACSTRRGQERIWLDQFITYLEGVIRLRTVSDSWTYCVALSNDRPADGGSRTYRQFVEHDFVYFHPYGGSGGWPTEPPNFMAFRWNGAVQRVHRVKTATVIPSLLDRWPDIPASEEHTRPHAVYELGPQLPPTTPLPNGAAYRANRMWVLLDQLQTAETLAGAIASTKALTATT